MTDPSIVDLPSGVPPWPWRTDPPQGGQAHTQTSRGGGVVTEICRAAAITGRDHGYLTRQLSRFATAGCTCGWFHEGDLADVEAQFVEHVEQHS